MLFFKFNKNKIKSFEEDEERNINYLKIKN